MKMLNLGCGSRFSKDWINVDFVSTNSNVIVCNLTNGIPFSNNEFDVVYHSHVLEHFTKNEGFEFIKECYRVLKPNGIIRIAVPDLENIIRSYLLTVEALEKTISNENTLNHEWAVIELIDQMVRTKSGGEMANYWQQDKIENHNFVQSRVGYEFSNYRNNWLAYPKTDSTNKHIYQISFKQKIKNYIKDFMLRALKTEDQQLAKARFRSSGEVHQWMYDKHSLKTILESIGFTNFTVVNAIKSNISNWEKYAFLDIENEQVRKPDSLFIEAKK